MPEEQGQASGSRWRRSLGDAHPLFSGNPRQYADDWQWRRMIPKAGTLAFERAAEVEEGGE